MNEFRRDFLISWIDCIYEHMDKGHKGKWVDALKEAKEELAGLDKEMGL